MRPFRHLGAGEIWMRSLNRPVFRFLMRLQGIGDRSPVSAAEFGTYLTLALMPGPPVRNGSGQTHRPAERRRSC
jgi:hypothetical protein